MSRRCSRRRCARSIRTACAEARPGAPPAPTDAARPGAVRPRARYCKPAFPAFRRPVPCPQASSSCSAPLAGVQAVAARSDRTFARHSHEQFGIGVIRHGAQASHSGRGQVQAQAGQVITVNPGEIHDGAPLGDAGRAWQMLYLDPSVAAEAAREFLPAGEFEFPQPVFDDPVLAGCAGALCASHRQCRSAGLRRAAAARAGARGGRTPRRRRAIRALGHPSRPRPHR